MPTPSAVVVTDLTIYIPSSDAKPDTQTWHRIDKNLILDKSPRKAWLYVALAHENTLKAEDLVIIDISVGAAPPDSGSRGPWEERPGGIWVLKGQFSGTINRAVTQVDVLFGTDAVDPRPQWVLMPSFLQLDGNPEAPVARLTVLRGRAKPIPAVRPALKVREDGKFKIVQISDMHMVTGVGECNDAIDAQGKDLPAGDADTLTVDFVGSILDVEKPDLVVLTGDQLHHDIFDSQTALFKAVAPIIERSIPFAVVFGNHDSEGEHALPHYR
ncbi:Phosphatase DCR2 [Fusarium oxysporum f. sp. rapae]|uniref:Phosphatase DCR2 n=1 Tax=Fusarium oxysporum f. sp. rapae TaxID=485398 RepID=A0A8J5TMK1_FUSOX|nr:Phosphatase DCR2 [Fusarium oxysporum f. sp. rapae]